jgi:hypothetical protein
MSQSGMVAHWLRALRDGCQGAKHRTVVIKLAINAVGAGATATALLVIIVAKFGQGGWVTLIAIPCVIVLLKAIKRYYERVESALRDDDQLQFRPAKPPFVLVMTREWNRLTDKALCFAMQLSPDVMAVHLAALRSCASNGPGTSRNRRLPRMPSVRRNSCS